MSPRPRLPKIMWNEDSIRVETRTPTFDKAEEAFVVCCQLVKEYHGEFAYASA